jgi:PhnB protein
MSERFLFNQLDQAIAAIIARDSDVVAVSFDPSLAGLAQIAEDLRDLPRADFKIQLEAELRKATMTTEAQPAEERKPATHIRAGYNTITPYLTVARAEELLDFMKQALGAVETFRTIGSAGGMHAEAAIGDSKLMIGGMEGIEEILTALHLYVPDADAVYQRALAAGATSLEEPVDQFYGDREAGVKDPSGNVWWIATHKLGPAETYIPQGLRAVTPFLHPIGVPALIEFLKQAFDAEEVSRHQSPEGLVHHATVRIGDSMIEMGEARGESQPMPPALYTYVEDVDVMYERAVRAGATAMQPPTDQPYGDRTAWVKDAWGNIWYLATQIRLHSSLRA